MVGAVIGTPGTIPTGWVITNSYGVTTDVVALGTSLGLSYVDLRLHAGSTNGIFGLIFTPSFATVPAANGDTWTASGYFAVVGGAITNNDGCKLDIVGSKGDASFVEGNDGANTSFLSSLTGTLQRFSSTYTLANALSVAAAAQFLMYGNGGAVDVTIRIAGPQLEKASSVGPFVPTP